MEVSRTRSKAQKEVGLEDMAWKKFLDVTLEAAKGLVKGKDLVDWNWKRIKLPEQLAVLEAVTHELDEQGISGVTKLHVRDRLLAAIQDLRTKETQRINAALTRVNGARPYDPIRDV